MIINFYHSYNKYSLLQRYIRTVNTTLTMHDHACWCAACFTTVCPRISTSLITWNVWWLGHVKKPKPVENVPKATPMMNACNWTLSDCPKKTVRSGKRVHGSAVFPRLPGARGSWNVFLKFLFSLETFLKHVVNSWNTWKSWHDWTI